ncbi:hypothetical protein O3Q52_00180 [Streptomyces sp. ActVer]|uniref:hypothetical protein n=1 Tax=Streptomyces sp. ActVer TaxID=3014558 RepID=UPI0022B2CA09|nr:hypothetical protein [Streptomyces sp. ActVer]MCZ4506653.1 hypothetical protein [Streptomyces sp. ActVer]
MDVRVTLERGFDLGRGDVLATPDDGVVGTAPGEQIAVRVEMSSSRVANQPSASVTGPLPRHSPATGDP